MLWCDQACYGVLLCDMFGLSVCVLVWCVLVWCVLMWCVLVWCVLVWCGMFWYCEMCSNELWCFVGPGVPLSDMM